MVAEKTMRFRGKRKDLDTLSVQIVEKLESQGFQTQMNKPEEGIVIQAAKASIPRALIAADRAFTILVSGKPNDFSVRIGIGKMLQNLGVTAAESLVVSGMFLAVDVPEMLWTKVVEDGIAKDIAELAGGENRTVGSVGARSGRSRR